eukprot:jgi/Psemu1/38110/gm1.38110_g
MTQTSKVDSLLSAPKIRQDTNQAPTSTTPIVRTAKLAINSLLAPPAPPIVRTSKLAADSLLAPPAPKIRQDTDQAPTSATPIVRTSKLAVDSHLQLIPCDISTSTLHLQSIDLAKGAPPVSDRPSTSKGQSTSLPRTTPTIRTPANNTHSKQPVDSDTPSEDYSDTDYSDNWLHHTC